MPRTRTPKLGRRKLRARRCDKKDEDAKAQASAERWARFREKTCRTHISIPGILFASVKTRWAEFFYRTFSPYAVELVCFDLRKRHDHDVTQPLFTDPAPVQDAVDRRIVASYAPRQDRQFGLLERLLRRDPALLEVPVPPIPPMGVAKEHVYFPKRLWPLIEQRWRELDYDGVSSYVTGLIRYDLMLSGPHKYFNGKDTDPELLAALDLKTEEEFLANRRQRILLDDLIEQVAGRKMEDEERKAAMKLLAQRLRALTARGRVRG